MCADIDKYGLYRYIYITGVYSKDLSKDIYLKVVCI